MAEKEYIEREAAIKAVCQYCNCHSDEEDCTCADNVEIMNIPVVDVVEVVQCKNCRHAFFRYNNDSYPFGVYACRKQPSGRAYKKVRGDFWCAYGEKMDGKVLPHTFLGKSQDGECGVEILDGKGDAE